MFTLQNDDLSVDILDPYRDQHFLGPRFCHSGYIWQITNNLGDHLLSGPEYPSLQPRPFNGQGLPEVFRFDDKWEGLPTTSKDNEALIIGVGRGTSTSSPISIGQATVSRYVEWIIESSPQMMQFSCNDSWNGWAYHLQRRVTLEGYQLSVENCLSNEGDKLLPVHWYLHPFFPVQNGQTTFSIKSGVCLPPTEAFTQDQHGTIHIEDLCQSDLGEVAWLGFPPGEQLEAQFSHPICKHVGVSCDYPASYVLFWANARATSVEPYMVRRVLPGETITWKTTYTFGSSIPVDSTSD